MADVGTSYFAIDLIGNGGISLFVKNERGAYLLVNVPKRQARALAARINQNIDYAEGKAARRPGTPHLWFSEQAASKEPG